MPGTSFGLPVPSMLPPLPPVFPLLAADFFPPLKGEAGGEGDAFRPDPLIFRCGMVVQPVSSRWGLTALDRVPGAGEEGETPREPDVLREEPMSLVVEEPWSPKCLLCKQARGER